jgi:hypothetical protein
MARTSGRTLDEAPALSCSVIRSSALAATMACSLRIYLSCDLCKERTVLRRLNPGTVAWNEVMRRSNRTPSIVPNANDRGVYLVVDDFGSLGQSWRETNVGDDFEMVVDDLLEGQSSSSVSTSPRDGLETFRKRWPRCCEHVAQNKCGNCRHSLRTSCLGTQENQGPVALKPLQF